MVACPVCGGVAGPPREQFTQATRSEPMRSLGWWAYCRECAVSFRLEREDEMVSDVLSDAVMADADAAYERGDQEWFNALPTDTLAAMWRLCCDIETMPSWDDEVYDALYPRGYFKPDQEDS